MYTIMIFSSEVALQKWGHTMLWVSHFTLIPINITKKRFIFFVIKIGKNLKFEDLKFEDLKFIIEYWW
jgi:hypothetical protein